MERPKVQGSIDLYPLISLCEEYFKDLESGDYNEDGDDGHYIFEEAVKMLYGKDVFDYINSKL